MGLQRTVAMPVRISRAAAQPIQNRDITRHRIDELSWRKYPDGLFVAIERPLKMTQNITIWPDTVQRPLELTLQPTGHNPQTESRYHLTPGQGHRDTSLR